MNNRNALVVPQNHANHHPKHLDHQIRRVISDEASSKTFECSGCNELGFGPRYQCARTNCPFVLHNVCFNARPQRSEELKFMGMKYKFKFSWAPPKSRLPCDACGRNISGFWYHGEDSGGHAIDLHPCCTKLERTIRNPNKGMTTLTLKNKLPLKAKCKRCGRNDNDGNKGWSYVSSKETYGYHVSCMKKWFWDKWELAYVAFNVVRG